VLFEHCDPRQFRLEVELGDPARRERAAGVGEPPAPALEANGAAQRGDRLALSLLGIETGVGERVEPLAPGGLAPARAACTAA
jgi:hypothetical protein